MARLGLPSRLVATVVLCLVLLPVGVARAEATFRDAFSPQGGATDLVVDVIKDAKRSIHLAAYSFTSKRIAYALARAAAHGVAVQIVADSEENKNSKLLPTIARQGVAVRYDDHYRIMHDKFMIVDGDTVQLGSFNYTYAAEVDNAENVFVIAGDAKIAGDYDKEWKRLWDESRP